MSNKLYYLGVGAEFIKAQCKEYKTLKGALAAAAKDESLVVWDEDGNAIGSLTDEVPEGALTTNEDGSVNAYDNEGNKVGTVDAATFKAITGHSPDEKPKDETEADDTEDDEAESGDMPVEETAADEATMAKGTIKVICEGTINIRRSASFDNNNVCGRAAKGQTYHVKRAHTVKGKTMYETIDGLFIYGGAECVEFHRV